MGYRSYFYQSSTKIASWHLTVENHPCPIPGATFECEFNMAASPRVIMTLVSLLGVALALVIVSIAVVLLTLVGYVCVAVILLLRVIYE